MSFIDSDSDCITGLWLRSTIFPVQTRLLPSPAPCLFAAVVHVALFSRNALCLALLIKSHSTILMAFTSTSFSENLLLGKTNFSREGRRAVYFSAPAHQSHSTNNLLKWLFWGQVPTDYKGLVFPLNFLLQLSRALHIMFTFYFVVWEIIDIHHI